MRDDHLDADGARAALRGLGWSETTLEVWLRAKGHCEYCDRDLQATADDYFFGYNVDHVVPLSRGGTDQVCNYALACRPCNLIKRNHVARDTGADLTREERILRAREYIQGVRIRNAGRMADAVELLRVLGL